MGHWLHSGAAVVGQSHMTTATPCQDKFQVQTSDDGNWLAIAVCDGAGSAEFAEQGAIITSAHFCQELIKLSNELSIRPPGEWINDFVIDCVLRVREKLRKYAQSDDIRKYHCTLVAALIGRSGGFSIHIGDGAILGGSFSKPSITGAIELNTNFVISMPENGEYSNETFFITEGNWVKHLRITPLPALDWLIACTDGGASLVLDHENFVKPNFLAPFIEAQVNKGFKDSQYVEDILNDPKANKLTTDDKTLVLAVRSEIIDLPASLNFTPDTDTTSRSTMSTAAVASKQVNRTQLKTLTLGADSQTATVTDTISPLPLRKKKSRHPQRSGRKLIFVLSFLLFATILLSGGIYAYFKAPIHIGESKKTNQREKIGELPSTSSSEADSKPQGAASEVTN
jgi:hypothetical protein